MKSIKFLISINIFLLSLSAFSQENTKRLEIREKLEAPIALLAPGSVIEKDLYSEQTIIFEVQPPWAPMNFEVINHFDKTVRVTDIRLKVRDPLHQKTSVTQAKNLNLFIANNGIPIRSERDLNCDGVVSLEDQPENEVSSKNCYLDRDNIFLKNKTLYFDDILKGSLQVQGDSIIDTYSGETLEAKVVFEGWMDSSVQPMRSFYQEMTIDILAK